MALNGQERCHTPITIQPIPPILDRKLGVELGWSEGFFAETAGALADDDSFVRQPQGEYEARVLLDRPSPDAGYSQHS